MQIKLSFDIPEKLVLPLGHHATLQGFIYHMLSNNSNYASFLHDQGYTDGVHSFKLFVFSTLQGHHRISGNKIIYSDKVCLEIRSPQKEFCNILIQTLQNTSAPELYHQPLILSECTFSDKKINNSEIQIKMLSPLTLSTTYYDDNGRKKTRYISPVESDFLSAVNHNTSSKYKAAFPEKSGSEISVEAVSFSSADKYVTKFNEKIVIVAWNGTYLLSGNPEMLSFLYNAGLGSRNSQGFGMFECI